MITISGQLAIKTIPGRYGKFNVGHLSTSIGEFSVKNPQLEEYDEGKYDGDFMITEIRPSMYMTGGRMVIENRAYLAGMTISSAEALSADEADKLSPQVVDPIVEEAQQQPAVAVSDPDPVPAPVASIDPLTDTTPFAFGPEAALSDQQEEQKADAELFGTVWPLSDVVKLDATVDRRLLRKQRDRLDALGYDFNPMSQDWHLAA
jgi:hypothetical protein